MCPDILTKQLRSEKNYVLARVVLWLGYPFLPSSADVLSREYAPQYALRSYFYLTPSLWAAKWSEDFLALFGQGGDKPQVFPSVRATVS